jgi:hypothetical protein
MELCCWAGERLTTGGRWQDCLQERVLDDLVGDVLLGRREIDDGCAAEWKRAGLLVGRE